MTTITLKQASTPSRTGAAHSSVLQRVWAGLAAYGRRNAKSRLRALAALHTGSNPTLASRLNALAIDA